MALRGTDVDSTPDERLRVEIQSLAVLDIILGGSLAVISTSLALGLGAALHSHPGYWPILWRVFTATGVVGVVAVATGYAVGWRSAWRRGLRLTVSLGGAVGLGALLSLPLLLVHDSPSRDLWVTYGIWLCPGFCFLAAGAGLWKMRTWGRLIQMALCGLGASALGYWAFLLLREAFQWRSGISRWLGPVGFLAIAVAILISVIWFLAHPATKMLFNDGSLEAWPRQRRFPSVLGTRAFVIGILGLWAIFGILFLPNLHQAVHRGRQKRTLADLRSVATAVEAYAIDHLNYPRVTSMDALAGVLEPEYTPQLPRLDGWSWPIEYHRVEPHGFVVRSPGYDGRFEHEDPTAYTDGAVEGFHRDLVFSTVSKPQWPEGMMGP